LIIVDHPDRKRCDGKFFMGDHNEEVTHPHKLPVFGCRRFRGENPGIAGDSAPVTEIDPVLQGYIVPCRVAKDKDNRIPAGPEGDFIFPDKNPPCSTRDLFRFRIYRPERICRKFTCMCQEWWPPFLYSGWHAETKKQLPGVLPGARCRTPHQDCQVFSDGEVLPVFLSRVIGISRIPIEKAE
jgi:hypothetical protein